MDAAFDDYLFHLTYERRLSPRTVAAYGTDVRLHLDALRDRKVLDLAEVDVDRLREYLAELHDAGYSARSRSRARAALRGFYGHLASRGTLTADPSRELEGPRTPKDLPRTLTEQQVLALVAATGGALPIDRRDRALLEMAYGSGLRASELIGLGTEQIDLREKWVRVHGKGDKERLVPLGRQAADAVRIYLTEARPVLLGKRQDRGVLFLNARGGGLSRVGFWKILKGRARRAGVDPGLVHPHMLRHTYATHLLEGGASLRVVQELLGHSSIKTTEVYTAIDRRYLRRAHTEFHPRGSRGGGR